MNFKPVFLDTEFTGLEQPDPLLVSVGLYVSPEISFYAELPESDWKACSSKFFWEKVEPLLDKGHSVMPRITLAARMALWFEALGEPCQLITDAPTYDFMLIESLLNETEWPTNLARIPFHFSIGALPAGRLRNEFAKAKAAVFTPEYPKHHALTDARALAAAWAAVRAAGWSPG